MVNIVIREEELPKEWRTPLLPEQIAQLTQQEGYHISLVGWPGRIIPTSEYEEAVAKHGNPNQFSVIEPGSWKDNPDYAGALVVGIKELLEQAHQQEHHGKSYLHFAHIFKGQKDAEKELLFYAFSPEELPQPVLYDHEFFTNPDGTRTHAFGASAGYSSTAMSVALWTKETLGKELSLDQEHYPNRQAFFDAALPEIIEALNKNDKPLNVLVIGGEKGRSAKGAMAFIGELNARLPETTEKIKATRWGREETAARQTPNGLEGIEQFDIIVNCVLTHEKPQPFISNETLTRFTSNATIIADVTCDVNELNRIQIQNYECTGFEQPAVSVAPNVLLMAVSHSPAFFPREASEDFANQFFPHFKALLEQLREQEKSGEQIAEETPWGRSVARFENVMEVSAVGYRIGTTIGETMQRKGKNLTAEHLEQYLPELTNHLQQSLAIMRDLNPIEQRSLLTNTALGIIEANPQHAEMKSEEIFGFFKEKDIVISKLLESDYIRLQKGLSHTIQAVVEGLEQANTKTNETFWDYARAKRNLPAVSEILTRKAFENAVEKDDQLPPQARKTILQAVANWEEQVAKTGFPCR